MVDARRLVGAGRRGAGHGEVLPPVARAGLNDPPGVRRPNRLLAGKEAAGWERGCWLAPPPLLLSVRRGGSQSWGKKGCWLAASKLLGWAHYTPPPNRGVGCPSPNENPARSARGGGPATRGTAARRRPRRGAEGRRPAHPHGTGDTHGGGAAKGDGRNEAARGGGGLGRQRRRR